MGRLAAPVGVVDRPFEQRRDPLVVDLAGAGGNVVIAGGPQTGKSTLLRTLICSLALTHTPREVQFFCLDFGGGALRGLDGLPHVSGVAGRRDTEAVRRTVAEVAALLDEREARFAELGIDSIATYRRRRAAGEFADDPFGDVFLVVDGWGTLRQEYEELEQTDHQRWPPRARLRHPRGASPPPAGRRSGSTCATCSAPGWSCASATRPSPRSTARPRRTCPRSTPGRGLTRDKLHFLAALPADRRQAAASTTWPRAPPTWCSRCARPGRTSRRPRCGCCRDCCRWRSSARSPDPAAPGIPIGINETKLAPVCLDFASDPHSSRSATPSAARPTCCGSSRAPSSSGTPRTRRGWSIADYRRGLLGAVEGEHLLDYAPSGQAFTEMVGAMQGALTKRLPGPDVTPDQLRDRSWWTGPELYILVDDYDLVAGGGSQPAGAAGRAAAAGPRHRPAPDHRPPGRRRLPGALRAGAAAPAGARQPRAC